MLDIETYRELLAALIKKHESAPSRKEEMMEGTEELSVLARNLHEMGAISLRDQNTFGGLNDYLEAVQEPPATPSHPANDYLITYTVNDISLAKELLKLLKTDTKVNPLIGENIREFGATPLHTVGDFVIYDNGQISHAGRPLKLEPRLQDMFILLLRQANKRVTFDDLQEIREGRPVSRDTLVKYITELKRDISEQLSPCPISIVNTQETGYTLLYAKVI